MSSWRERFRAAEVYIIGIGMPVSIGAFAVILPIQFLQYGQISAMTTKVDDAEKKADLRFTFLDRNAEGRSAALTKKLDEVDKKLDSRQNEIKELKERIAESETDPRKLLERIGVVTTDVYTAVAYGGSVFILPKTESSFNALKAQGYTPVQISPILTGFSVVPATSANAQPTRPDILPWPNPSPSRR